MNYHHLPDQLFEMAYALVQAGRHAEARRTLVLLLQQAPNHVEALVLMGYLSHPAEAKRYFMEALHLDPYHTQAQRGLLNIEQKQQRRLTGILVAGVPILALAIGLFVFIGLNVFAIDENPEPTLQALGVSATATRRPANPEENTGINAPTLLPENFASLTPIDWLLATPQQFVPPTEVVVVDGPTATPTLTPTPTVPTDTPTATETPSATTTPSLTLTETGTSTQPPTSTDTATPTVTASVPSGDTTTPTATPTSTATFTATLTPSTTPSATVTPDGTLTATSTPTTTDTATRTPTSTVTPSNTPTRTETATASSTPTASLTPTATEDVPAETATPTATATEEPAPTIIDNSFDMLALINQARCSNGLNPVTVNPLLNNAATNHSMDMATNNFVGHTGSDGSDVTARVGAQNYPAVLLGENIIGGSTSVDGAFGSWGTEHILNPDMREMGLGHVYYEISDLQQYWTLVMGSRGTTPITCQDVGFQP